MLERSVQVPPAVLPISITASPPTRRPSAPGGFTEKVERTSVALDSATRTLRVEMDLKNDERVWRPGLYAYVNLQVERPDALIVPAAAVFSEAGQSYCAAVADGKVQRRAVEVGIRNEGDTQILSGLRETDQLIAKDAGSFVSGQPVEVAAAEPAPAPAAGTK